MPYASLGYRPATAAADVTGNNDGNWTALFDQGSISNNVPYFELYHFYVSSPFLASGQQPTIQVALNQGLWDYNQQGAGNGWDPSQPMLLTPGDTLYFYFNLPVDITPAPVVTAWFRYDTAFTGGVITRG